MQMPDITALIYAHRGELAHHERYRDWLAGLLNGLESYGVSDLVTLGFQRIVTNRKIFREPTPLAEALRFVDVVRHRPQAIPVVAGPRHWSIYRDLCQRVDAAGADVTDAYLAALAIEHGHDLVTEDKGLRHRFPELRTTRP